MFHLKTLLSLLTVLIAVVPVTPKEEENVPAADVPAADVPTTAGGQGKQPHSLRCAKRCTRSCLGRRNEKHCATNFVSQHCMPFEKKVEDSVLTKCLDAIECKNSGMKLCPDTLECLLEDQCCVGCGSNYRCLNHWCIAKGSPSFTLTWTGYGTYPQLEYLSRKCEPVPHTLLSLLQTIWTCS